MSPKMATQSPLRGKSGNQVPAATGAPATALDSPAAAAQFSLSLMLVDPGKPLLHLIQESIPGRDVDFYFETLKSARGIIERMIGGLPKRAGTTSPPIPVDRGCFLLAHPASGGCPDLENEEG